MCRKATAESFFASKQLRDTRQVVRDPIRNFDSPGANHNQASKSRGKQHEVELVTIRSEREAVPLLLWDQPHAVVERRHVGHGEVVRRDADTMVEQAIDKV